MDRLDLAKLEQLLIDMEPSEIRVRYADQLSSSPECRAMLDHFEAMDGYLSELKESAGPPPEIRFPRKEKWARIMPWALPLAAVMVIGVLVVTRTLPDNQATRGSSEMDVFSTVPKAARASSEKGENTADDLGKITREGEPERPPVSMDGLAEDKTGSAPTVEKPVVAVEESLPPMETTKKDEAVDTLAEFLFLQDSSLEPSRNESVESVEEEAVAVSAPVPENRSAAGSRQERDQNETTAAEETVGLSKDTRTARAGVKQKKQVASIPYKLQEDSGDNTAMDGGELTGDPRSDRSLDAGQPVDLPRIKSMIGQLERAWNNGFPFPEELFTQTATIYWPPLNENAQDLPSAARDWSTRIGRRDRPPINLENPVSANGFYLVQWRSRDSRKPVWGSFRVYLDARGLILKIE